MSQYRQGDVLLERVESIPDGAVKAPNCVLVVGAVTGHSHRFDRGATQFIVGEGETREQYVRVTAKSANLVHSSDHDPIRFEKGDYKVIHQREQIGEDIQQVVD